MEVRNQRRFAELIFTAQQNLHNSRLLRWAGRRKSGCQRQANGGVRRRLDSTVEPLKAMIVNGLRSFF